MKFSFLICIVCFLTIYSLNAQTSKPLIIGETIEMNSKILDEERILNVYLPNAYHKDSIYNVIYLLDGSYHEDFIHITGLVQFFELQLSMPQTIVVGIANVDRKRDFTFYTDDKEYKDYCPTCGESENFIRFIKEELQPFVNQRYPLTERKILIGQSLGGLLATEILLKEPDLFTDYLIVSPSLWWDDESLLKAAPSMLKQHNDKARMAYVSVGTEGEIMERDAKDIFEALEQANKDNMDLHFQFLPEENHATILHHSIYKALQLLFPYQE